MESPFDSTTSVGIASCLVASGCFMFSYISNVDAAKIQSAKPVNCVADLWSQDLLRMLPVVVAVTGKAWSARPRRASLSDTECVIEKSKEVQEREKQQDGNWRTVLSEVKNSTVEADWSLVDGASGQGVQLSVRDGRDADDLYLKETGQDYISEDSVTPELVRLALQAATRVVTQGPSKQLGRHRYEETLPVGTTVTVVGEVVQTRRAAFGKKAKLEIRKPSNGTPFVISNEPVGDIVKGYQVKSSCLYTAGWAFAGIGVVILSSKAVLFGWSKWRARKIRQRREEADRRRAEQRQATGTDTLPDLNGNGNANGDRDNEAERVGQCIICMERRIDMVFPACGHMCTCRECSPGLNRCPICRTRAKPFRVYHA